MNIREFNYQVYINDILPKTTQRVGVQNEHNATVFKFRLMSELKNKLRNISAGRKLYYRFDGYDSSGGYHPSEPKELKLETEVLEYTLEQGITSSGGILTVYLIICMMNVNKTELIVYSRPASGELESVLSGTQAEEKEIINLSAPILAAENSAKKSTEKAKEADEKAKEAAEKAKEAAEQYELAKQIADKLALDLKIGKTNFIGVCHTKVYDGFENRHITLIDGKEHYAEYGDVVFTEEAFKLDVNGDGYTDEYDLTSFHDGLSGRDNADISNCDVNDDGKVDTSDLTIFKFLLNGVRGAFYYRWNGNSWESYKLKADMIFNPNSINAQSGIAVEAALNKAKEDINDGIANKIKSGEFKGEKGDQGLPGEKGEKGDTGDSYVLTETDKTEIANIVLKNMLNGDEVSY